MNLHSLQHSSTTQKQNYIRKIFNQIGELTSAALAHVPGPLTSLGSCLFTECFSFPKTVWKHKNIEDEQLLNTLSLYS